MRSLGAVRRLFDEGTAGFVYPFRYMVITEQSTHPSVEVLFSVPKRNHKRANKRNLLRRRMKEAYRLNKSLLAAEDRGVVIDLALIYSSKELLPYKSINNAISRILREVAAQR